MASIKIPDMDPTIGWAITAVVLVVVLVVAIARQLPRVGPDERLVVFRMGRTNASGVRGPGRTFLVPVVDRALRIDMRPQRAELEDLPATTADASDLAVDLSADFRVANPVMFAVSMPVSTEFAVRSLARRAVAEAVASMTLGDALTAGRLEETLRPRLDVALIEVGCNDPHVDVERVRARQVTDADERKMERLFAAAGHGPDADVAGSRTLAGDLVWAGGRLPRMLRYALFCIPVGVVVAQVVAGQFGFAAWSGPPIAAGAFFGFTFGAGLDRPIGRRRVGWRRRAMWWTLMTGWFLACISLLWVVGRLIDAPR